MHFPLTSGWQPSFPVEGPTWALPPSRRCAATSVIASWPRGSVRAAIRRRLGRRERNILRLYGALVFPSGLLAARRERWDEAERTFNDAVAMNERIGRSALPGAHATRLRRPTRPAIVPIRPT
jgi:hypothetical protein